MLSLANKFLFIHVHKTGGNSIQSVLEQYSEDDLVDLNHSYKTKDFEIKNYKFTSIRKHSTLRDYQQVLDEQTFKSLYKFACVRNPWERMMSFYFSPHRLGEKWSRERFIEILKIVPPAISMLTTKEQKSQKSLFLKPEVDFVIRFENLQNDFDRVCEKIKIPQTALVHKNRRKENNYLAYYDEYLCKLVEQKFVDDIEIFDYKNPLK